MCFFQHSRFADLIEAPVGTEGSRLDQAIQVEEMVDKFGVGVLAEPQFDEAAEAVWIEGKDES